MKNLFSVITLCVMFLLNFQSGNATTITIDVKDAFFDPDFLAANVGDIIHFEWKEGTHTTTSDIVPNGAASWDSPITSQSQDFFYTLTVAGHYHYFCLIHGQMMDGVIEASGASGISSPVAITNSQVSFGVVTGSEFSVHYHMLRNTQVYLAAYDLVGNTIMLLENRMIPAGNYELQYQFDATLPRGLYILNLQAGDMKLSKKVIKQ